MELLLRALSLWEKCKTTFQSLSSMTQDIKEGNREQKLFKDLLKPRKNKTEFISMMYFKYQSVHLMQSSLSKLWMKI